ncbi:11785_t:CDS:10 [Diversispora eburnea]|uniref:11785_t:CDS:1 n=1 Tax=Diversispora eburnea TaxID=1213867 RepID=A0A9N8ZR46_9GLOM|nr:11785_t:CDS:10 [Diversispora eburnea]
MDSLLSAPSSTEVTVAEVDGKLIQLRNASDPNIDLYVRAEGVLFQHLQMPANLIHPDISRITVKDLPSQKSLYGILHNVQSLGQSFPSNFISNAIFNTDTQCYVLSLEEELKEYPANLLAWHPYVSIFAIAHKDDAIFLYDLRTETWFPEILENELLQKDITCMSWKPLGGNILAVGCKNGICLWEISLEQKKVSKNGPFRFDAWMPDGSIILWNTSSGNGTILTTNRKVAFLSWSPIGEILFSSSLWTSKIINAPTPFRRPVQTACWTKDGRVLFLSFCEDQCIRSLSITPNLDVEWLPEEYISFSIECAGRTVKQLAIDPTGERLVVCFKDTPLLVVFHAKQPSLVPRGSNLLSGQGIVRGPKWREPGEGDTTGETFFMNKPDPKAVSINFAKHFMKGALLSLIWEDGQISFLPFYFRPTTGK